MEASRIGSVSFDTAKLHFSTLIDQLVAQHREAVASLREEIASLRHTVVSPRTQEVHCTRTLLIPASGEPRLLSPTSSSPSSPPNRHQPKLDHASNSTLSMASLNDDNEDKSSMPSVEKAVSFIDEDAKDEGTVSLLIDGKPVKVMQGSVGVRTNGNTFETGLDQCPNQQLLPMRSPPPTKMGKVGTDSSNIGSCETDFLTLASEAGDSAKNDRLSSLPTDSIEIAQHGSRLSLPVNPLASIQSENSSFRPLSTLPSESFLRRQVSPEVPYSSLSSAYRENSQSKFRLREPWTTQRELADAMIESLVSEFSYKEGQDHGHSWSKTSSVENSITRNSVRPSLLVPGQTASSNTYSGGPPERFAVVIGLNRKGMNPRSHFRKFWAIASLTAIFYDAIMVPIDLCFALGNTSFMGAMGMFLCCFWSVDMALSFVTGQISKNGEHVHMNLDIIIVGYLKTWFCPDLLLLTVDWSTTLLWIMDEQESSVYGQDWLQGFRFVRIMRLMRMLRFLRMLRLKPLLVHFLIVSSISVNAAFICIQACLGLFLGAHMFACLWHFVGSHLDNGWVHANNVDAKPVWYRYMLSLATVLGHLQGVSLGIKLQTTVEAAIDVLLLLGSLITVSFYLGLCTHIVIGLRSSDDGQVKKIAYEFCKQHKIPWTLHRRLMNFLSSSAEQGPSEMIAKETKLFQALSADLQEDLHYQVRHTILVNCKCFDFMGLFSMRALRHICHGTVNDVVSLAEEVVFNDGDVCRAMLFVNRGELRYSQKGCEDTSTKSQKVSRGHTVSEPVLWTRWDHCGELTALKATRLLEVGAEQFGALTVQYVAASVVMTKYAQHYLCQLNQTPLSDLVTFDIAMEDLPSNISNMSGDEDHFMFISHYKQESGTEATLMREGLESILKSDLGVASQDFASLVFIDSENLEDLSRLLAHVQGSEIFVLLLTPGLFSRPWCLIELVTASNCGLQIVPVEVQRPGIRYEYPSDEFYDRFRAGDIVDESGIALLEQHGMSLEQAADAIRRVFLKIALPFSPHKSGNVRQAELMDIVKRSRRKKTLGRPSTAPGFEARFSGSEGADHMSQASSPYSPYRVSHQRSSRSIASPC